MKWKSSNFWNILALFVLFLVTILVEYVLKIKKILNFLQIIIVSRKIWIGPEKIGIEVFYLCMFGLIFLLNFDLINKYVYWLQWTEREREREENRTFHNLQITFCIGQNKFYLYLYLEHFVKCIQHLFQII